LRRADITIPPLESFELSMKSGFCALLLLRDGRDTEVADVIPEDEEEAEEKKEGEDIGPGH
jgi:hypothetical protein